MRVGDLVPGGDCGTIKLQLGCAVAELESDAIENGARAM